MRAGLTGNDSHVLQAEEFAGMIEGPCKLVVASEVRPEKADEIAQWYDTIHAPALMGCPGFLSAEIMRDETGLKFVAMYDMESESALMTDELKAVRGFGPFVDEVRSIQRWVVRSTKA